MYAQYPFETVAEELSTTDIDAVELWQVPGWCEHLSNGIGEMEEVQSMYDIRMFVNSPVGTTSPSSSLNECSTS